MDIFENDDFVVVNEETSLTVQVPTVSEGTEPETPLVPQAYSEELPSPEGGSSLREFPSSEERDFSRGSSLEELLFSSERSSSGEENSSGLLGVFPRSVDDVSRFALTSSGLTVDANSQTEPNFPDENANEEKVYSVLPFLTGIGLTLLAVKIYNNLNTI
jgi:hypothetical protein